MCQTRLKLSCEVDECEPLPMARDTMTMAELNSGISV
jgi:hypothetical protein